MPPLGGPHSRLERGTLWLQVVALEPCDVVEGAAAPERAEGGAGGAIFREVVEEFGQRLGA